MIAGRVECVNMAVETAEGVRNTGRMWLQAPVPVHIKLLTAPARKVQCNIDLRVGQHVDCEARRGLESGYAGTGSGQTPQQQRRVKRYGGEGIRRHAHGLSVGTYR